MIVSKPLREPFRDGSTVLARNLVQKLPERFRLSYFGDPERPLRTVMSDEVLAAPPMPFSPGVRDKARVLMCLAHPRRRRVPLHFFFTPNRVTSSVLAVAQRLSPGRLVVQDLTSSHGATRFVPLLRSLDAVVVHSDHTRSALTQAGLESTRVHCIRPGVHMPELAPERRRPPCLLYAGDLDRPVVDRLLALGRCLRRGLAQEWSLCIAARPKSTADSIHRDRLREALASELSTGRVKLLGHVHDMDAIFERATLQLFLADHVRRKVDLPLVLLEGMARGVPLLTLDVAPVTEIFDCGHEHGLRPGMAIAAADLVDAVARTLPREDMIAEWGRAARELVAREFTVDRMVREYARLYDELEDMRLGDA
jgi:glycosyltransferase involved in cell wall biosynthesis